MSTWLKGLIGLFFMGLSLLVLVVAFNEQKAFNESGEIAQINPNVKMTVEQLPPTTKFDQDKTGFLAHMTYVDVNGKTVEFKRFLTQETYQKITSGEPVYVEYVVGEWNSERVQIKKNGNFFLSNLLFIVMFMGSLVFLFNLFRKTRE